MAVSKQALLAHSWTQIALAYEEHLVPRFQPWAQHTLQLFAQHKLPPGHILVPACGPGPELLQLAGAFPGRHVMGLDLAPGMVEAANARCHKAGISHRADASVGDAMQLPGELRPVAGIFSMFGLQQLPEPQRALGNWVQALKPGGILAVTLWPSRLEDHSGPWQRLADLTRSSKAAEVMLWERELCSAAQAAGGTVLHDERAAFPMHWASAEEFWQIMTEAGPWHVRKLALGAERMAELREAFLGGLDQSSPLQHSPAARTLIVRREVTPSRL